MSTAKSILDLIRADARVKYLADLGADRHALDVPRDLIEQNDTILKVRGKSPKDLSLLRDSVEKTGNAPVYMPCVLVQADGGTLRYYLVDGHQRFLASTGERLTVQFISRWNSVEEAFADAVSLNFARYASGELDILSILAAGQLTKKQVSERTGMEETKVHRLAKVAGHSWLWQIIQDGVLGYGQAGKLVDACNAATPKLQALQTTLTEKYEEARTEAKRWRDIIRRNKNKKYDSKAKANARIESYFKNYPWDQWVDLLKADDGIVRGADGQWRLNLDSSTKPKNKGVWIGTAKDWETEIAVYGFFGSKVDEIATDDLQKMYDNRDLIYQQIEVHLKRRLYIEAAHANPPLSANPTVTPEAQPEPSTQQPSTRVGRRSED